MKIYLKTEIQKISSIRKVMELLLIKFNSLAFIFPEVITLCFLFLPLPVTTATDERNISKLKTDKEIPKYFDGTETAI